MNKQKRWSAIVDACKTRESVSVDELVELLAVSPATVRRDLQEMEDLNVISRFHGGARISVSQIDEPAMVIKSDTNIAAKRKIALMASRLVKSNQMIYIDAGSTTYEMIQYLNAKNITVVTPGVPHLSVLGERNIPTVVLGGTLRWSTEAITGKQAIKQLESMYFDLAFVGTNGIHEQIGFTTSNEMEAETKSTAIHRAKKSYILTDSSKFNVLSPVRFAGLDEAIILTDSIPEFNTSKIRYQTISGDRNYTD